MAEALTAFRDGGEADVALYAGMEVDMMVTGTTLMGWKDGLLQSRYGMDCGRMPDL